MFTNKLFLLLFLVIVNCNELKNCFISHKNIRISCGKALDIRSPVTVDECQKICLTFNTQCQTIQYDYSKNACEIYSVPSPLKINATTAAEMKQREMDLGNTECALASILPVIGTSHLIPQWDCLSQFTTYQISNKVASANLDSQAQFNSTISVRPPAIVQSEPKSQKPDIKIKKLGNDRFEILSNTKTEPIISPLVANNDILMKNFAVEVLPVVPDCPIGEHSRIQVIDGVEVNHEATVNFTVSLPEQCVQACRMSTYSDGSRLPLLCRSAQFDRANRKCSLYSDAINPNGFLEYKPNQRVIYIEKICIPDLILPLSCDDVFRRIPQHILLGHASDVVSVASEQQCILECITSKAERAIDCHSILHYPDFPTMNCILNTHTRHTKNQYFTPELAFKVDYVELGECVSTSSTGATISRSMVPHDPFDKQKNHESSIDVMTTEWSEWTKCSEETSTRSRQRNCDGCKEIIQFIPCFSNNNFDLALQTFIKEQQLKEERAETSIRAVSNKNLENSLNKLDSPSAAVIEFPQKILNNEPVAPSSVEFFGPPQSAQQHLASRQHAMNSI